MPNLNRHQWPAPSMWPEFEDMCLDLWSRIWRDPKAQKVGRSGQKQNGVDISGTPESKSKPEGVQCKLKEELVGGKLTLKEVEAEIAKAEEFKPGLGHLTFATTAAADATLEEQVRLLSEKRMKEGKFGVSVVGWEWIRGRLGDYPDLVRKYGYSLGESGKSDEYKTLNQATLEIGAFSPSATVNNGGVINQSVTIIQNGQDAHASLSADLEYARKRINEHRAAEVLDFLKDIEDRVMGSGDDELKFRLLNNRASAYLDLEKYELAGKLFLEAKQYSDTTKAKVNAALGSLLSGRPEDAVKYADEVLKTDPLNATALSYKLQAEFALGQTDIEKLEAMIPAELHDSDDSAMAIAIILQKQNKLEAAREKFESILANGKERPVEVLGEIASLLIEPIASETAFIGQLTDDERLNLERARDLLTEVWDVYDHDDTRRSKTRIVYNRSIAKRLLGDIDGSLRDTEEALELEPTNILYKKHQSLLLAEKGDKAASLEVLKELAANDQVPEAKILLAERIIELGENPAEAIAILRKYLEDPPEENISRRHAAYYLSVQLLISQEEYDEAQALVDQFQGDEGDGLFSLMLSARLKMAKGDQDSAISLLEEAYGLVTPDTPVEELATLADALYAAGLFDQASNVYERFINPSIGSSMSTRLLNAYYRAGKHDKALALCEVLRRQIGSNAYLAEMESSIREDFGDLKGAEEACLVYLKDNPEDRSIQLRLAVIYYREEKFNELDSILDSINSIKGMTLPVARQLAMLCKERGKIDKGYRLAYEARRKFFEDPEVHLGYIGIILGSATGDDDPILKTETAADDTVVFLKNKLGETKRYIIESRENPRAQLDEISIDSSLASSLLGKVVGDKVEIGEQEWEVVELKHKYLHALHESMNNFSTWFPGVPGLQRITFDPSSPEAGLAKILENVDQISKRVDEILSFYRQGKLTVGAMGNLLDSNMLDAVYALLERPEIGLRASAGNDAELWKAHEQLQDSPRLIADGTAVIILHRLDAAEPIVKKYGKLIVPRSLIDELRQKLQLLKSRESSGYMTLGKRGGSYLKDEITPERVERQQNYITGLLDWINNNCEIVPVSGALAMNAEQRQDYSDLLGVSSLDAVLLAKESGRILLSDDERLRSLAKEEFEVNGVWTQAALYDLQKAGNIAEGEYVRLAIQLSAMHYRHTRIEGRMLLEAVKESDWSLQSPYVDVVAEITSNDVTDESLASVVGDFLYLLWKEPQLPEKRQFIAQHLLSALGKRGFYNGRALKALKRAVSQRFKLFPTGEAEVQELIDSAIEGLGLD